MKRFIVSISALIASLALVQAGDQVGRYQLMNGSFEAFAPIMDKNMKPTNRIDIQKCHGLLRLDTVTGEVDIFYTAWVVDQATGQLKSVSEWRNLVP
jgi:hypothetical protein